MKMMMKKSRYQITWKWLVLWTLWLMRAVRQPTTVVRINSGLLRGSIAHDGTHRHYLGIPYATVEKRFQAPGPSPKWFDIFEATDEHVYCQQRTGTFWITGHEDCLVVNVYTPVNTTPDASLPVMVWIHGGGFLEGSGSRLVYGPENLVAKDVILVTLNYRLTVPGFLCLRTPEVPGNAGMKDQVAALKWVQKNIKAFGGDPDNVTIFGESAGAASVSLHVVSPMSKGLFHKAIVQSGSSIAPWATQQDPLNTASRLALAMGHLTENPHEVYDIFMNKSNAKLISARIPRPEGESFTSEIIFVPCVESAMEDEQAFLTDHPYNILSKGTYNKVPMIIGTNDEEGYFIASFEKDAELRKMDFEKALPKDLLFPSDKERKVTADGVRRMYMGDKGVSRDTVLTFSQYVGDMALKYPVAAETELILESNHQPVYSYLFSHSGWRNWAKFTLGLPFTFAPGASHADDLMYLFNPIMTPSMWEYKMIDTMTMLWTNFAKYGKPNGSNWGPAKLEDPRMLRIGTSQSEPLWNPSLLYWRQLYQKYRRVTPRARL